MKPMHGTILDGREIHVVVTAGTRKGKSMHGLKSLVVGLATIVPATALAAEEGYARPQLLMEPSTMINPAVRHGLVILDARPRADYDVGHLPGARWVDHGTWKDAFGSGGDAPAWSQRIGRLGIDGRRPVVIYDDNRLKDAARIWWILRYWGVDDVRLLNGGWKGWNSVKGTISTARQEWPDAEFAVSRRSRLLTTKEDILQALRGGGVQIIDARSEAEYCGTDLRDNRRGGAIPGAKHLEWSDLIDHDTDRFLPADQLGDRLKTAGIELHRPTVSHCQSGGRASVMAFALELMGADDVSNYYLGWSEWGNAPDTPIEKPEAAAEP